MLRPYQFLETDHSKLHEFILAFFNRIEFETGEFDISFFEEEFRPIVNRHRTILKQRCKDIYEEINKPEWTQTRKSALCERVRNSNEIERICEGEILPTRLSEIDETVRENIRLLFLNLYTQVLDGEPFTEKYTKLRSHFDAFRKHNKNITLCPVCGIGELKTDSDETRDQYDHFLVKTVYPFSSVNFKNLVLVCKECNSFDVKGEKDIITESTGKLFYPYSKTHTDIKIEFGIQTDDTVIENIEWQVGFSSDDDKSDEITSWKSIYNIENRYLGFLKGRIEKWYKHFWEYMYDDDTQDDDEDQRKKYYFKFLKKDKEHELNFLRLPAIEAFLRDSVIVQADYESRIYCKV